jgi:hypothetical protein
MLIKDVAYDNFQLINHDGMVLASGVFWLAVAIWIM